MTSLQNSDLIQKSNYNIPCMYNQSKGVNYWKRTRLLKNKEKIMIKISPNIQENSKF